MFNKRKGYNAGTRYWSVYVSTEGNNLKMKYLD